MDKRNEFPKTDWQKIIQEIGLTGREIGKIVGISESYVSYLRLGKRGSAGVDYDIGTRILALHKQRQLEKRAETETK